MTERFQNGERRVPIPMADDQRTDFEHSLSMDDAPQTVPAGESIK